MLKPMSPRQDDAMRFIVGFHEREGIYPGLREIAAGMGIHSTNGVQDFLVALRRKGWLKQSRYVIPTEGALVELLGPRCQHCRRGHIPRPAQLKVVK